MDVCPIPTTSSNNRAFRSALFRWYAENGRDLPWRHTRDPYAILVSEIMLQQTQVATVIPYYREWLRRFPDFRALARSPERDVLHAWQGLGYYSRARNLHAAAARITKDYAGRCPETVHELRALPGVGRYTANAILTFAFDRPVPVVEANIGRLLSRIYNVTAAVDATAGREAIWRFAALLVTPSQAGTFNSALMDLGAIICLPRAPKCAICPAKTICRATDPLSLPRKKPRPATRKLSEQHFFTLQRGRLLLQNCETRWRGMWMLPELNGGTGRGRPLHVSTFPLTHHRITLEVFPQEAAPSRRKGQAWFPVGDLGSIPMPSPHRRAITALLGRGG